jgi:succinate dehydrogenase/fumarate reductase flavoprotein subunit
MANTNRRALLKGLAIGALATSAVGLTTPSQSQGDTQSWDVETDVVVLGYGATGAAAAITAADEGAEVIILEKQPETRHTSNTKMCLGVYLSPDNAEDAAAYLHVASRVNVDMPESIDVDEESIAAWAQEIVQNKAWLDTLGAAGHTVFVSQGRDASWPGNDAIKAYQITDSDGKAEVGVGLFRFLDEKVRERNVVVRWSSPARQLVREDDVVTGVVALGDGGDIRIKARRGVILATGGFNGDEQMVKTFLPGYPMTFYGNPDNTGDGLRMAQALGADLWHMTVLGGGLKSKFDDFPTAFTISFGQDAHVVVDKSGKRFRAENHLGGYSAYWNILVYDAVANTWPRIPSWLVFDERRRTAGPLTSRAFGAAGPVGMYEWSDDNSREIERGWILKADTMAELADKMAVDAETFSAEMERYNGFASSGADTDHGRMGHQLIALDQAPFYAVKLLPGLNNTFGGPRRNHRGEVLDVFARPIAGLYSAGELGSIYVQYPQGGANVGECFSSGRVAGRNAARRA